MTQDSEASMFRVSTIDPREPRVARLGQIGPSTLDWQLHKADYPLRRRRTTQLRGEHVRAFVKLIPAISSV